MLPDLCIFYTRIWEKVWRATTVRALKWLSPTVKFTFCVGQYSNTFTNSNYIPSNFPYGPKWYTFNKGIWPFWVSCEKLRGLVYGSRRVIDISGGWTWQLVHKNSTFFRTEIAPISLIMLRFWWSFFCFLRENQDNEDLAKNCFCNKYEIPHCTPYY